MPVRQPYCCAHILRRDALGWEVSINASTNDNKLVNLGGVPPIVGATQQQRAGRQEHRLAARRVTADGLFRQRDLQLGGEPGRQLRLRQSGRRSAPNGRPGRARGPGRHGNHGTGPIGRGTGGGPGG